LKLTYLMEDTDLSGGVRIQLAQADALIALGHEVTIHTRGLPLTWRASSAQWIYVDDFAQVDAAPYDFVIGTFWTTVAPAWNLAGERALHLCQGYEGAFTAYESIRPRIDEVYRLPIPKLVVTPSLVPVCQQFGSEVVYVGQIVDDAFYRASSWDRDPPRVLLAGASQIDFKGIDVGYAAAAHARWQGAQFELVRVSPWAPSSEEPVTELAAEFHVALTANEMTRLMHSCDIFLGPSRRDEGFGLPAAEAMASAIPTVLTRIPSFLSFDSRPDYALFADEDDAEGLGEALLELLSDEDIRARLRTRGRAVAEQFRAEHAARRIESYLTERLSKLRG
jgi:glycosyltransferase involved in cell wall biosynthesis